MLPESSAEEQRSVWISRSGTCGKMNSENLCDKADTFKTVCLVCSCSCSQATLKEPRLDDFVYHFVTLKQTLTTKMFDVILT